MNKNKQLLYYIIKHTWWVSITQVVKLAYLIDLTNYRNHKKRVSGYEYIRYYYWPYDSDIESDVNDLVKEWYISADSEYTRLNEMFVFHQKKEADIDLLDKDIEVIDSVLDELKWLWAKMLTKIAYKTKPMVELWATLWWNEGLWDTLNFDAK